jgi:hypothetical protein
VSRAALCSIVLLVWVTFVHADPLQPGSDAPDCMNVLRPGGMLPCPEHHDAPKAPSAPPQSPRMIAPPPVVPPLPESNQPPDDGRRDASPSGARHPSVSIGGITEKEVDDYLASWGKPPREAVRALLNPTDENVRALVDRHKRDEVVRNYMAERMTTMVLEQNPRTPTTPRDSYMVLPRLVGLQMTLYVTPDCPTCDDAVTNMKQLALEYPIVSTRVVVITESEFSLVQIMLRWQLTLPTATITGAQAQERRLAFVPMFEVVDSRSQKSVRLSGPRKPLEVVTAALNMRKAAPSDPATPAQRGNS